MDTITKEKFDDYERVRLSGSTNMFDTRRVSKLSGLGLMTIHSIMKKYEELKRKFEL